MPVGDLRGRLQQPRSPPDLPVLELRRQRARPQARPRRRPRDRAVRHRARRDGRSGRGRRQLRGPAGDRRRGPLRLLRVGRLHRVAAAGGGAVRDRQGVHGPPPGHDASSRCATCSRRSRSARGSTPLPMVQATELLLHERTPRNVAVARSHTEEESMHLHVREVVPPVLRTVPVAPRRAAADPPPVERPVLGRVHRRRRRDVASGTTSPSPAGGPTRPSTPTGASSTSGTATSGRVWSAGHQPPVSRPTSTTRRSSSTGSRSGGATARSRPSSTWWSAPRTTPSCARSRS